MPSDGVSRYTRMIVDAIHDGSLAAIKKWEPMEKFGLMVPKEPVKEVPEEVLHPKMAWMRNHGAEALRVSVIVCAQRTQRTQHTQHTHTRTVAGCK